MNKYIEGYVESKIYARVGMKAVITNDNGEILVLTRSKTRSSRPGGWDFAGGGLDLGEDPSDGIKREIKEETGLDVTDIKPIYVASLPHKKGEDFFVMIGYSAKAVTTNVTLSWEHDTYKWITKDEAHKLSWPDLHKSFLDHL